MAKSKDVVVVAESEKVSIDDFCARISETLRSPELIAGFYVTQRDAPSDTFEAYRARLDLFRSQPV